MSGLVDDRELQRFLRRQLEEYPDLFARCPPSWPFARRFRVTQQDFNQLNRLHAAKAWDTINLAVAVGNLGCAVPPVPERKKRLYHKMLSTFDGFARRHQGVPGGDDVTRRLFRNPSPEEFWGVLAEVLVTNHIEESDYMVERFSVPLPGTEKDADLLLTRGTTQVLLDVEAKAPYPLESAQGLDEIKAAATREAREKADKKFSQVRDERIRAVCLVWRPGQSGLDKVDAELAPWRPHLLALERPPTVVHHFRIVVGWNDRTDEPYLLLQDLIPGIDADMDAPRGE